MASNKITTPSSWNVIPVSEQVFAPKGDTDAQSVPYNPPVDNIIQANQVDSGANQTNFWRVGTAAEYMQFKDGVISWNAANTELDTNGNLIATSATLSGNITATTGNIGGWVVTADDLKDVAGTVGMSSAVTGGDDIRFFAGHTTPSSAPFYVTEAGVLVASSATITGAVNATSGKFGTATDYWSVGATGLTAVSAGTDVIINYGKTDFTNTQNGFILGYDYSASLAKFYIGDSTSFLNWDGADLNITGDTVDTTTLKLATTIVSAAANDINTLDVLASSPYYLVSWTDAADWQKTLTGVGTITVGDLYTRLNGGNGDGSAKIYTNETVFGIFDTSKNIKSRTRAIINPIAGATTSDQGWGLHNQATAAPAINIWAATDVSDHAKFHANKSSTLISSSGDGTTQETNTITGITITSANDYQIIFTAGASVKFYINGVLKFTHATNIPDSGTRLFMGAGLNTVGGASTATIDILNPVSITIIEAYRIKDMTEITSTRYYFNAPNVIGTMMFL